jgi:hypothetical protein
MTIKIVIHDFNNGKNPTQACMLRLEQKNGVWAWESEYGLLGNGDKSGWLTFNGPGQPDPLKAPVSKIEFRQNNGPGNQGNVALALPVRGWPLNFGPQSNGTHAKGQGATFPDGPVTWKVNGFTP